MSQNPSPHDSESDAVGTTSIDAQRQEKVILTKALMMTVTKNRAYEKRIKSANALLKNEADAQDAVQGAYVNLEEQVKKGKLIELRGKSPEEAVRLYLNKTLMNRIKAIWRQRTRAQLIEKRLDEVYGSACDTTQTLSLEEEKILTEEVSDETKQKIERLSPKLKALCLFLLKHIDKEPSRHWLLWAKENELDPTNQRLRNTFDKTKERLREKFNSNGAERSLTTGRRGGSIYEN